jgi:hypothetical protein
MIMRSKKLTPIEILQKQKILLQAKSDTLTGALEGNFEYLQRNIVPLLSDTVLDVAVSKMPVFVQDWVSRKREEKSESLDYTPFAIGVAKSALSIIPFFIKGKKGVVLSFILQQIRKLL